MNKCVLPGALALALCVIPAAAVAQPAPLGGRLTISINAGGQPGSDRIEALQSFERYDELAAVTTEQHIDTGNALFDIGASYRVTPQLGVGIAVTSFSTSRDATMTGSVPHPLLFSQPRTFSLSVAGLEHKQRAVHLQAIYFMPFIENVDFAFSAGPTFFSVSQDFARFVDFNEVGPPFTEIDVTHAVSNRSEGAVGFNIGGEVTYAITRMLGVGALLRYTRGTADFDLPEAERVSIDVGNVQFAAGVRLRF